MDWFEIWFADKQSMLETMVRNMASDLNAGYSWNGKSIVSQRSMIDAYQKEFDSQIELLKEMDEKKANRWCKLDLLKRGAIEL